MTRGAALHPIPRDDRSQVWLDFDGTLTRTDLLDELINRHSRNDSWKLIEERWATGQIGSRQCLEEEFALLNLTPGELALELERVRMDSGAADLLGALAQRRIPFAILSDGVDSFIRAILHANGLTAPLIRANAVRHEGDSLALECPHHRTDCISRSAHCKCASARALADVSRESIYVGDGRSDLCAARHAEVVFAKGALARALAAEGIAFRPFETLRDVQRELLAAWDRPPHIVEDPA